MKPIRIWLCVSFISVLVSACAAQTLTVAPTQEPTPTDDYSYLGLTDAQISTLLSLEQVDEYPLYTMQYYAPYETVSIETSIQRANESMFDESWGCALFSAFTNSENMLYGRNFDWEYSPAVLLYTDPSDGYASVSMVDIAYLGFQGERAKNLVDSHLGDRVSLLDAPYLPFDGFNETGLAVGMAAVPAGNMPSDPGKETVDSLLIIREMLDHASNVNEAVSIITSYNIVYGGGPPLHYLIADAAGQAALVEFFQSEMHIIFNENPWHNATNFLRSSVGESSIANCWRYDKISERLGESGGRLSPLDAINLLGDVSQESTQWSIVYGMISGDIHVAMGKEYNDIHFLHLEIADE